MASTGLVGAFDRAFHQCIERIERIVREEFAGCLAVFDQNSWPIIRFHIEDSEGTTLSKVSPRFSVAELDRIGDRKLRMVIRERCQVQESEQKSQSTLWDQALSTCFAPAKRAMAVFSGPTRIASKTDRP